ncbi:hypothetical protein VP01_1058g1 [Puccinia sorghi]|uniref:Uncharacterized protein n=1 Tax=Puccinia sorghi TaxID=27349 RepID=A0A0L6VTZ5_9BASI|nr:hypothetical protein VP01_1058g1 [Puccinia sorghi]
MPKSHCTGIRRKLSYYKRRKIHIIKRGGRYHYVLGKDGMEGILTVRGGRKEVWEERHRPPNPGWNIFCVAAQPLLHHAWNVWWQFRGCSSVSPVLRVSGGSLPSNNFVLIQGLHQQLSRQLITKKFCSSGISISLESWKGNIQLHYWESYTKKKKERMWLILIELSVGDLLLLAGFRYPKERDEEAKVNFWCKGSNNSTVKILVKMMMYVFFLRVLIYDLGIQPWLILSLFLVSCFTFLHPFTIHIFCSSLIHLINILHFSILILVWLASHAATSTMNTASQKLSHLRQPNWVKWMMKYHCIFHVCAYIPIDINDFKHKLAHDPLKETFGAASFIPSRWGMLLYTCTLVFHTCIKLNNKENIILRCEIWRLAELLWLIFLIRFSTYNWIAGIEIPDLEPITHSRQHLRSEIWKFESWKTKNSLTVLEIGYHTKFKKNKIKKQIQAVKCIHLPPPMLYPKMKHMMKMSSILMDRHSCLFHHLQTIALHAVRETSYLFFNHSGFEILSPCCAQSSFPAFFPCGGGKMFHCLFYAILPFHAQIIIAFFAHIFPKAKLLNNPGEFTHISHYSRFWAPSPALIVYTYIHVSMLMVPPKYCHIFSILFDLYPSLPCSLNPSFYFLEQAEKGNYWDCRACSFWGTSRNRQSSLAFGALCLQNVNIRNNLNRQSGTIVFTKMLFRSGLREIKGVLQKGKCKYVRVDIRRSRRGERPGLIGRGLVSELARAWPLPRQRHVCKGKVEASSRARWPLPGQRHCLFQVKGMASARAKAQPLPLPAQRNGLCQPLCYQSSENYALGCAMSVDRCFGKIISVKISNAGREIQIGFFLLRHTGKRRIILSHITYNQGFFTSKEQITTGTKSQYSSVLVEDQTGYAKVFMENSYCVDIYKRPFYIEEGLRNAQVKHYNISCEIAEFSGAHSTMRRNQGTVEHMEVLMVSWEISEAFQQALVVFCAQSPALSCVLSIERLN